MMHLFNTLSKQKEEFTPIQSGHVGMYHCGPTVYDTPHIGNLRSAYFADILRRTFEYLNFDVLQVMNITDVGHLTGDSDEGEDKMTTAVVKKGLAKTIDNMIIVGEEYTQIYLDALQSLNIKLPHKIPRASDHIEENIELITKLLENKYAYKIADGVYFDTAKFKGYGALSNLSQESTQARIEQNSDKKNSRDFALWKFNTQQGWDAPWGQGFPGWHIECSSMSKKYLGDTFDIHTGGIDLSGTHHNNEIAQSEAASGKKFVHYWLHAQHLQVDETSMSKSKGNGYTLDDLKERGFHPLDLRYFFLQAHYRTIQNFTWEGLQSARNARMRLVASIRSLPETTSHSAPYIDSPQFLQYKETFTRALENDLATPEALALLHSVFSQEFSPKEKQHLVDEFDTVLGLDLVEHARTKIIVPHSVLALVDQRNTSRQKEDWETSDRLRKEINDLGYEIHDTHEGSHVSLLREAH